MMDMGIGGIASGAFGFAGAMMQAEEMAETRDMNWATNIMNWQQRNKERDEAIAMALKQRAEQKQGSTDVRGTRTRFVPGQGWVTTAGPGVMEMMQLQDDEQKRVLQHDLPMRRKQLDRNYQRSLADEGTADSLKRMFVNSLAAGKSDEGYASDLYQAQTMGLRDASHDAGKRAWTQAMRTGQNSNFGTLAQGLQEANNRSYAQAALQSKLMARGVGEKERQAKMGTMANLYNMFAQRAGQMPEISYKPQTINTSGTLDESMKGDLQTGGLAAQLFGKKGGEIDYISPNMGYGNAVAGLGSNIGSMFNRMGAQQAYQGGGNNQQQQQGITGFGGGGADYSSNGMFTDNEEDRSYG